MAGYWNNSAATEEAFAGGWFHSGDLVRADDEGFLYVVDRKKDMIISGGENIYCAEVENVLSAHPAVADIAVIAGKHERWGETPIAVIVPADPATPPTLDDLASWALGKLASYKKPTGIVIVDQLPRNAAGKVVKHELRARYGAAQKGGSSEWPPGLPVAHGSESPPSELPWPPGDWPPEPPAPPEPFRATLFTFADALRSEGPTSSTSTS